MLPVDHVAHFPRVNEKGLAGLSFSFCNEPQGDGDGDAVEELGRHGDDAFDEIVFDDFLPDFPFAPGLGGERAVCQDEPDFPGLFQMVDHVLNPREVGVAFRRDAVGPPRVIQQFLPAPRMVIEGRIGENEIGLEIRVQIVCEGVRVMRAEIGLDAADSHIDLRHFPRVGIGFLSVDGDDAAPSAVRFDEFLALDEHAAGAAAAVVDFAIFKRFENGDECLDDTRRRIKFAAAHTFFRGELGDAVFVGPAQQVFAGGGVAHVDAVCKNVHHVAEDVLIQRGIAVIFRQYVFQRRIFFLYGAHGVIQYGSDFRRMRRRGDGAPPRFFRDEEYIFLGVGIPVVFKSFAFPDEFVVALFKGARNVAQEYEPDDDIPILCGGDVAPQHARHVPQLLFKSDICIALLCHVRCSVPFSFAKFFFIIQYEAFLFINNSRLIPFSRAQKSILLRGCFAFGADEGNRTLYIQLGKLTFYR